MAAVFGPRYGLIFPFRRLDRESPLLIAVAWPRNDVDENRKKGSDQEGRQEIVDWLERHAVRPFASVPLFQRPEAFALLPR